MNTLSAEEAASLNDYDAMQAGLPRHVEATVILNVEGRPESDEFAVSLRFQPLAHARLWSCVTLDGYMIRVGATTYRLNAYQLQATQLVQQLTDAANLTARLALWPQLMKLAHAPRWAKLEVTGYIPNITVTEATEARLTTHEGRLLPLPLMSLRRPLTHGFVKHHGRLMPWAECYHQGYIPEVLQTKRHGYVQLSADLIDALTLLYQASGDVQALPITHRHLLLTA